MSQRPVILEAGQQLTPLEVSRLRRIRAIAGRHFAEIYAVAAVLGVFALSDPSDRIGFATGAVVTALAALVAWRSDR